MTRGRHLPPGPSRKSAAWRGGAFMLGFSLLTIAVDWIAGARLDIGFGRLTLMLIVGGLTLSTPYGIAWLRGEISAGPAPPPIPATPHRVDGEPGATYVIVAGAEAPRHNGVSKAVKAKELGPAWYAAYTVLWRWPVLVGDTVLSGLWSLVARVAGTARPTRSTGPGEVDQPDLHAPPDRSTF